MKLLIQTLLLSFLLLVSAANAYSCSCGEISQRKSFRKANAVFVGQAIEYIDNPNVKEDGRLIVKFKVEKSWKGEKKPELIISSAPDFACGFYFEIGKRYLVYANGKELFTVTGCGSRTSEIVDAKYANYKDQQKELENLNRRWFRFTARLLPF
jgi:hypothetical protein